MKFKLEIEVCTWPMRVQRAAILLDRIGLFGWASLLRMAKNASEAAGACDLAAGHARSARDALMFTMAEMRWTRAAKDAVDACERARAECTNAAAIEEAPPELAGMMAAHAAERQWCSRCNAGLGQCDCEDPREVGYP